MVVPAASRRWNPDVEPVREILAALDVQVDIATRRELEKIFRRRQYFHGDGRGHLTFLIRTITESEGNAGALIAPIVAAVNSAMRPQWTATGMRWLEAFDRIPLLSILETMRGLHLFRESSLPEYLGISIQNRLWKAFGPDALPVPEHIAEIERLMALGRKLAELKSRSKNLRDFGARCKKLRGDIAKQTASEAIRVAQVYSGRADIYLKVRNWKVLAALSSPRLPASKRVSFESSIIAGEKISAAEVERARSQRRPRESSAPMRRAA
ncbi:hypothetical protein [Bradyrhizobium sp.]|uniref:hypothetical protein n=1 Tax=Bradyrhizobium sp. TaxID=376 RepID=UPI00263781C7|nr:hypothetical protein [Bradyrhizobium sp.]